MDLLPPYSSCTLLEVTDGRQDVTHFGLKVFRAKLTMHGLTQQPSRCNNDETWSEGGECASEVCRSSCDFVSLWIKHTILVGKYRHREHFPSELKDGVVIKAGNCSNAEVENAVTG